ncbi:MAG: LysR family transcriptional regulator [Burkholderiales bacterium]|nr:LysR family transcriptional regulator [Burkholderiales bacterium]MDE2397791.1 LysR family transcriptional regulator [Burkholderiales bacterium]MDE2452373.1 LysR family transcriptional regulator [Burkholderiales bacterium]
MVRRADFDTIDLYLIRVLSTVISERSVSRAAMKLQSSQPAVSAQLKRLRRLVGDPLLVRAGQQMQPTETALQLAGPAARLLEAADQIFVGTKARSAAFDPATSEAAFRVAASDYLDPLFLPALVSQVKREAPGVSLELMPLSQDYDYRRRLAAGEIDLVVGNWLEPPSELHLGRLVADEVVCLVSERHPAARRGWSLERYLQSEHVAPMPTHPGAAGIIDEQLAARGVERRIVVRASHFSLIPLMVADSLLVLTTGRQFCSRYVDTLPVKILRCPFPFPPMDYYQLWHERVHAAPSMRWFRDQVREVARQLGTRSLPRRGNPA